MQSVIRSILSGSSVLISEERKINVPISIPGSVYDALMTAELLEDPFYGLNEQQSQWVHETEWTILTEFIVPTEIATHNRILLKFYGIDTFANIILNNQILGTADNMHREYEFDITSLIIEGTNQLVLIFQSPSKVVAELYHADHERMKPYPGQLPGRIYAHKAQYSYGWDWGPALPDIGIWRPIELIGMDEIRLLDMNPIQTFSSDYSSVHLEIKIDTQNMLDSDTEITYRTKLHYDSPQPINFELNSESNTPIATFDFAPELWWIAELGVPNLYCIIVQIVYEDNVIDEKSIRIGLRELQLIRRSDEWGESFFFQLNGVSVFAKGADWIPVHSFIPKGRSMGLYRSTLTDALAANMNMIRLWGGGVMEDDELYEFCDEQGILLWQDFPFACGFNPLIKDENGEFNPFYQNIEILAKQNVVRLRHHPSLALWSGNNEIEEWMEGLKGTSDRDLVIQSYCDIFERLLPSVCAELDPTRPYWPSSPSSGGSDGTGIFPDCHAENIGDNHFWSVWHGGWDFTAYREDFSRFQSEFGFESFPDLKTCAEFCPPEQYAFESPIMRNHQKNMAGNQKILDYMKKRFTIPEDFTKQVTLSQLTQAEAIEYGVEHWRRNRGVLGKEHCMGTLYWQLNDCWPVASWSSIDYSRKLAEQYHRPGRWKALHYYARRFYRPVIVSIAEAQDFSEIWGINDKRDPQEIQLQWSLVNVDGTIVESGEKQATLEPCASQKLADIDLRMYFGYRWLKLTGTFSPDKEGHLQISIVDLEKANLEDDENPFEVPKDNEKCDISSFCAPFVNQLIRLKLYSRDEGFHKAKPSSLMGSVDNYFEGKCILDEEGHPCIQKRIAPSNPQTFDVPLVELIDPFLEREDMVFEITAITQNPPLILSAKTFQEGQLIHETFKTFISPGNLPLKDPQLSWTILEGSGFNWTVEITASNVALDVHFASDSLDFWTDDNYFFMMPGTRIVKLTVLDPLIPEEIQSQLQLRSLIDLL